MRTLDDLVGDAPTFAGLAPAQLELIAGCGANRRVPGGTYLFHRGAPAEEFFLLREGSLALEIEVPGRGPTVLESFHDGDVVGWSWLFSPYRWQFDGRAVTPLAIVAFDGACLRAKCEADHELGYQLMRRFAGAAIERLQATRLQLLDVYGHPGTG